MAQPGRGSIAAGVAQFENAVQGAGQDTEVFQASEQEKSALIWLE
jgi:hypothetical protein